MEDVQEDDQEDREDNYSDDARVDKDDLDPNFDEMGGTSNLLYIDQRICGDLVMKN